MIYARTGDLAVGVLSGAPPNLIGSMALRIEDSEGGFVGGLNAGNTALLEAEPGVYVATWQVPAELESGTYVWIWVNEADEERAAEDLIVAATHPAAVATPDPLDVTWRPSMIEVASWILTRTRDPFNNYLSTFTSETRPTDDQAEQAISMATADVAARIGITSEICDGDNVNETLTAQARNLAALRAAMTIELSFYPEQVRTKQSNYPELKAEWDDDIKSLRESVQEECGDVPGSEGDGAGGAVPDYAFDKPVSNIGHGTLW